MCLAFAIGTSPKADSFKTLNPWTALALVCESKPKGHATSTHGAEFMEACHGLAPWATLFWVSFVASCEPEAFLAPRSGPTVEAHLCCLTVKRGWGFCDLRQNGSHNGLTFNHPFVLFS